MKGADDKVTVDVEADDAKPSGEAKVAKTYSNVAKSSVKADDGSGKADTQNSVPKDKKATNGKNASGK